MTAPISRDDARLCASVIKEVARSKGIANDPSAVARLTVAIARLFNKGLRDRGQLVAAASNLDEIK
ncbi:hypothetical protein [Rhizobium sp. BK251]|uniref:hypothetical protein n=1 Tax=Rhizobium sp. BK251 TaxID=2512125 RepID=UPI0010430466|nr:hypothetical protein [Rhizobium sp. BK251]TCL63671.1 hypothetical protein EV286_11668 [Rhizobium sp. BK251]